jgi:hypothetical protein
MHITRQQQKFRTKTVKIPKPNEKLAEFIGIALGDGTLCEYFLRVSGDSRYDKQYFNYLKNLTLELFGVEPSIFEDKREEHHTLYFQISSKEICTFLHEKCLLPFGDKMKQKIILPKFIKQYKKNSIAFLRGLVDTDGSVSRRGNQFCIQFNSYHQDLIREAFQIATSLDLFTYKLDDETGTNSSRRVREYFRTVGSSNVRHIIRFIEYTQGRMIYVKDIPDLCRLKMYKNLTLPYIYMGS